MDKTQLKALLREIMAEDAQAPLFPVAPAATPAPAPPKVPYRSRSSQPRRARGRADDSQAVAQPPLTLRFAPYDGSGESVQTVQYTWPHVGETGQARFALCTDERGRRFRLYEKTLARLQQGESVILRIHDVGYQVTQA